MNIYKYLIIYDMYFEGSQRPGIVQKCDVCLAIASI